MKQGGAASDEGPDQVYNMKSNRARLWLAGSWFRIRMIHGFAFGNEPPANIFAGYPGASAAWGLSNPPTRALFLAPPCPNSRCGFRTPSFLQLTASSRASRRHTTFLWEIWNLSCSHCHYSPKWPFPRSRNPTIMPHTQFVANYQTASLPPIHGTAQMHRFQRLGRNLLGGQAWVFKMHSTEAALVRSASQPLGHCSLSFVPSPCRRTLRIIPSTEKNNHFNLSHSGKGLRESTIITRTCQNRLRKSLPLSHQ